MSELEIIIAPDPELKKKCELVLDFNIQVECFFRTEIQYSLLERGDLIKI